MAISAIVLLSFLAAFLLYPFVSNPELPICAGNDFHLYLADSYFAASGQYGWTDQCNNGFAVLSFYPPLSFFFISAFSLLFGSLQSAFSAIFVIAFISHAALLHLILRKRLGRSKATIIALMGVVNPIYVNWFFKTGRLPEMVAFVFVLALLYFLEHSERDKQIRLVLSSAMLGLTLLTHLTPFLIASGYLIFRALYLKSGIRSALFILASSLCIASFWIVPFFIFSEFSQMGGFFGSTQTGPMVSTFRVVLFVGALMMFFFSIREKKSAPHLAFALIISFLTMTALINYVPLYNKIFPHSFSVFLAFLLLLSLSGFKPKLSDKMIVAFVILTLVGTLALNGYYTYLTECRYIEGGEDVTQLYKQMDHSNRHMVFLEAPYPSEAITRGIIEDGVRMFGSCVGGQFDPQYIKDFSGGFSSGMSLDKVVNSLEFLGVDYLITRNQSLIKIMEESGFEKINESGEMRLFKTGYGIFPYGSEVIKYSPRDIIIRFQTPGDYDIKITYFPRWTATDESGKPIPLRSDKGHISLTTEGGEVRLSYGQSQADYLGAIISFATLLFLCFLLVNRRSYGKYLGKNFI